MTNVINKWYVGPFEWVEVIIDNEQMLVRRDSKGKITAYDYDGNEIKVEKKRLKQVFDEEFI